MDDLIAEFITETGESLGELDTSIVRLEQNPGDTELISRIFRVMHTIKGTCGFLGLPRLEKIAHKAEDVLGLFRDGKMVPTRGSVSLILEALDSIKLIIAGIEAQGKEPEGDDGNLIKRLEDLYEGRGSADAAPPAVIESAPLASAAESALSAQSLRVNVDVLENLMTMVSELVLTRNQLLQIVRAQQKSEFNAPLQRLNLVVSDLQDGVMKTRMQPVGNAWAKLPRIIRDICSELGKKIDLEMHGQDTELDRQVLEMIKDPLTHMVRNSADHGIESPADRRAKGKPETGKIVLRSFHEGGHIIIRIEDDGKGLATDRIKKKIVQNGLASESEVDGMTTQQIQQYIFRAGFSTAEKVTAVSGRGVGMDVVRSNIEKIGGSIELKSVEGEGTSFTIKIPLTLAIVPALIVDVAGERFAIPQLAVRELVMANQKGGNKIEMVNNSPVFRLRDHLLPLVCVRSLLGLGSGKMELEKARYIVVIRVGSFSFGIIVDRVFDTEEIVVKPVTSLLRNLQIFSGNTILGDGHVIMILDPAGILKFAGIAESADVEKAAEAELASAAVAGEEIPLLLFTAGGKTLMAVPLDSVSRLEEVDLSEIENAHGQRVVQYRGHLMPLHVLDNKASLPDKGRRPVIVFAMDGDHAHGLLVDRILDISKFRGEIEMRAGTGKIMGSAIIGGKAADIINPAWLNSLAHMAEAGSAIKDQDDPFVTAVPKRNGVWHAQEGSL